MLTAEFIAGVLAGVENTLDEVIERVDDGPLCGRLSALADQVEDVRASIYPESPMVLEGEGVASDNHVEARSSEGD